MIDKESFLKKYQISPDDFEKLSLSWGELVAVYDNHAERIPKLEAAMGFLQNSLNSVQNVHSIRSRVKNAEHLIEKIIRKRMRFPDRLISISNYREQITDLIGIRVLHLFKEDWLTINSFINSTWELNEKTVANVREGDSEKVVNDFISQGFDIKYHESGYRSIHYVIQFSPQKDQLLAEIQVRTIFEEAWSEIDHTVRYPYFTNDPLLANLLMIFNRIAGGADELGSHIRALSKESIRSLFEKAQKEQHISKLNQEIENLRAEIKQLRIGSNQKITLEEKLDSIAKTTNIDLSIPSEIELEGMSEALKHGAVDTTSRVASVAELVEILRGITVQKR